MFVLAILKNTVSIAPHDFGCDFTSMLIQKINRQLANYVIPNVGLCITFYDFSKIGASFILPGDPCTCTPVVFRYIVFQPLINEIMEGVILRSNREGIIIALQFFNDIVIEPDKLPSVSKLTDSGNKKMQLLLSLPSILGDESEQNWYWEFVSDGNMAKLYMEPGKRVRFRILNVIYGNTEPGIVSNVKSLSVKATMAETGLGCLSWWESSEDQNMSESQEQ